MFSNFATSTHSVAMGRPIMQPNFGGSVLLLLPTLRFLHAIEIKVSGCACWIVMLLDGPRKTTDARQELTRISFPVEILVGVAVALQCLSQLFACGTVCEGHMVVGNVVEEVDLLLWQHQGGGDRVHGRVTPALVEKAALLVEALKEVDIRLGAKPVEVANLKVGPLEETVSG